MPMELVISTGTPRCLAQASWCSFALAASKGATAGHGWMLAFASPLLDEPAAAPGARAYRAAPAVVARRRLSVIQTSRIPTSQLRACGGVSGRNAHRATAAG